MSLFDLQNQSLVNPKGQTSQYAHLYNRFYANYSSVVNKQEPVSIPGTVK